MFIELFKEFDSNSHFYKVSSLTKGIMAGALCPKVKFKDFLIENYLIKQQIIVLCLRTGTNEQIDHRMENT